MGSNTSHYTGSNNGDNKNDSAKVKGVLIGIRVVIKDTSVAGELYLKGFYGKPFGVRKPGPKKYEESLELSLIEAMYLLEKGLLEVEDQDGNRQNSQRLLEYAKDRIPEFEKLYRVYKDLREHGLIVRSGLKFGTDYSVYKKGPGLEHAPFLVHSFLDSEEIDPTDLVRAGRLSHSVKKKYVMAIVFQETVKYVSIEWFKP